MAAGWAWGHLETQQGDRRARGDSLAPKGAEKTEFSWASTSCRAPPASLPGPPGIRDRDTLCSQDTNGVLSGKFAFWLAELRRHFPIEIRVWLGF